ncbi:MAG: ABC transporter permease [Candidatus Omnitrophica bacterium]|nr:ABC transporter permease [Candidatus Omnitrophota bacterium]MCB9721684.1 ABC transporter permease [Candidatus Omnitrophota bacterium]
MTLTRNISAVVRKECLHILRDKRTLALVILMPLMQLILYGYGINTDVRHLSTAVYDQDQSSLSRRLLQALEQSSYFDINFRVESSHELKQLVDRGDAKVGINIPPDFTRDTLSGEEGQLQMVIDGTDSNPASSALNAGQSIITAFMEREGLIPVRARPIDFRPRMWYNPDLKSSYFMIPGLVGFLIQLLIPMITASAVVRERERGNIEQLLVTPVKNYEFIIGKLVPYIIIGMLISTLVIGTAHFLFKVPIRGSVLLLAALTFLFLIVCLAIGLFASSVAQNQQQASQIVLFFASPSILLSGFIFPRETMPSFIYYLGNIIPLTHFLKIIRGIILKGLTAQDLLPQILALSVMAVVIIGFSIHKFQKRLG